MGYLLFRASRARSTHNLWTSILWRLHCQVRFKWANCIGTKNILKFCVVLPWKREAWFFAVAVVISVWNLCEICINVLGSFAPSDRALCTRFRVIVCRKSGWIAGFKFVWLVLPSMGAGHENTLGIDIGTDFGWLVVLFLERSRSFTRALNVSRGWWARIELHHGSKIKCCSFDRNRPSVKGCLSRKFCIPF